MTRPVPPACETQKDDLAALAVGERLGERETALRTHLETCPGCRAYHAAMLRTVGAVRALPQPEPPAEWTERILQAARRSRRATRSPASGPVARWLEWVAPAFRRPLLASAVAAVAIASAAVALLVLGREETPARPSGAPGPRIARFEAPPVESHGSAGAPPPASAPAAPAEAPRTAEVAPTPAAPETVALESPTESPPAEDVSVARAPDEGRRHEPGGRAGLRAGERTGGTARADDVRMARERAAPLAAPAPVESPGAGSAGARFSPGREIGSRDDNDVLVAGDRPLSTARGEGTRLPIAETEPPIEAQGRATALPLTGALDSAAGLGGRAAPMPAAPAAPAPSLAAPPPPGAPATPSPSTTRSAGTAYSGSGSGTADGVALRAAPPPAPPAAPQEEGGYTAFAPGAAVPMGSYGSAEVEAEPTADRVAAARRQLADGDAAGAEATLEQALREQPSRAADATFLLGETYARQGKWADAGRTYELFLARYPDDPRADEARWRAADAYRRGGDATRAAVLLRQLLASPGYAERARTALAELSAPAAGNAEPSAAESTAVEAAPVPAESP